MFLPSPKSLTLWQISLFQRSKANHNRNMTSLYPPSVVANIIISKIESKSQLNNKRVQGETGCGKYHYFKDRKQITTTCRTRLLTNKLWQISLFQRSKANHNETKGGRRHHSVVANIIISKIESKSQPKNENVITLPGCGKYHYFKDRKQITTNQRKLHLARLLWQISLFQRSKANHNAAS